MHNITIGVPVYNTEKYLPECLDSILAQTMPCAEIILVDDGSTDRSGAICDEYAAKDTRIRVVHQVNQGVSVARNTALDLCGSDYIWFVDSDDAIVPEAIEILSGAITDDMELLIFKFMPYREKAHAIAGMRKSMQLSQEEHRLLRMDNIYQIRHDMFSGNGYFPSSASMSLFQCAFLRKYEIRFLPGYLSGQDMLFSATALYHTHYVYMLDVIIYLYRLNQGSITKRYSQNYVNIQTRRAENITCFANTFYPKDEAIHLRVRFNILNSLRWCIDRCFCHADNPQSYKQRKQAFENFMDLPMSQDSLRYLDQLPKSALDRIVYFCIVHRWFFLLNLYYRLRTRVYNRLHK